MIELRPRSDRPVPPRALGLSLAALAVPVVAALGFPDRLGEQGPLLWLLALVPAFLLAYYRGWQGVATALAAGMATLSLTEAFSVWLGREVPGILLGVVVAYLAISLGIGWTSELLHRDKDEAEEMAFTDTLTQLPNRRRAELFLDNEFAAAQRGRLLSVVLFDLDGFKRYNDRHGHSGGDAALAVFARVLSRTTRRMNLSARFGGEEFLSVLSGSDAEGAGVFAERVRRALRSLGVGEPRLTVSAGVAAYHPGMNAPQELVAAADEALYRAKRDGRDCVRISARREDVPTGPVHPAPADGGRERRTAPEHPEATDGIPGPAGLSPPPVSGSGRRVLLVEDDAATRQLISGYLEREGFSVSESADVGEGIEKLTEDFDVVVTDIRLPDASGNELVAEVKARWPATQVVVITGLKDAQVAAEALNAGADRYLFKPFGMAELGAHLADALRHRDKVLAERDERRLLGVEARQRETQAREAVLKGARALVRAVEVRDPYTRGHSLRVASYAEPLARLVDPGRQLLPPRSLRLACELHDVGKIGVPDAVLNKAGALTPAEFQAVKRHPGTGRRILEPLLDDELVLSIVSWHHERWDGSGYPDGLAAEAIPLGARVVGVVDTLDAMTSQRAYRSSLPWDEAFGELEGAAGRQFDPELVDAARRAEDDLHRIFQEHRARRSLVG